MRSSFPLTVLVLVGSTVGLYAAFHRAPQPAEPKTPAVLPVREAVVRKTPNLPGVMADGSVQLPNSWRLRPAGRQIDVGDLPVNIALHPGGQFAAVMHSGYREHEVVILDLLKGRAKIFSRAVIDQGFYGLTFSPDGRKLYASGGEFEVVHEWDFDRGLLSNARQIALNGTADGLIVGGLSIDPTGRELFACGTWGDVVYRIPLDNPANRVVIPIPKPNLPKADDAKEPKGKGGNPPSPPDGRKEGADPKGKAKADPREFIHPYTVLVEPGGKRAFVSLWAGSAVAVIDLEANKVVEYWPTASHPTEMVLAPSGKVLYVSCANSTAVRAIDPANGKTLQSINCALYPNAPNGNTPNSLCLSPDGDMLFVANADNNNIAVFNVADRDDAKPLGFIPTGWYPTSVRFHAGNKQLVIANGKGAVSKSNRNGPTPFARSDLTGVDEYIGGLLRGTVGFVDLPTPARMATYTKTAYAVTPLRSDLTPAVPEDLPKDHPIPANLGGPSPIKHVVYIVKENRTYDQVFGDMPQGMGEPRLCLFPEAITPNHHKLAREFVLLDNLYVEGEVSADGHEWTMGAYATDYVEKYWPLSYRGSPKSKLGYPSEGALDKQARPSGGYLWDKCIEAGVSFRTYGEWVTNGKKNADGTFEDGKPSVPAIAGRFDPKYRSYDLDYTDVKRAERFIEDLKAHEARNEWAACTVIKLPNDHTMGTRTGKPTPTAMVADNDLALGMIVEALSKSKFWKEMAIFVIEDDTQNGPDHIDAHRSVSLVVSPFTKRKYVDSTMYSTSSMLRTMELILNVKPMSQYDAAARPMYDSFQSKPDFTTYSKEMPKTDLDAKNKVTAWGAKWSDLAKLEDREDMEDDILFNEVIWKSVKGANSSMPAPVRAAFFLPKVKAKD